VCTGEAARGWLSPLFEIHLVFLKKIQKKKSNGDQRDAARLEQTETTTLRMNTARFTMPLHSLFNV